jgi:pyruvate,orthophosphate dikinase
MYGDVVMGVHSDHFEKELHELKERKNVKYDTDLTVADLKELVGLFKRVIAKDLRGQAFPEDPMKQLMESTDAVFRSWDTDRAIFYRTQNGISHTLGTAVNIQSMVFGNMGDDSGTGVAFTRSPTTGENKYYGEYLPNAQGEDVVAGIRTPEPIVTMQNRWPRVYSELSKAFHKMEQHFREMQDVEFTIERGTLYMLQTRKGKRTAQAAVRIAVDMFKEGLMTKEGAILAVDPNQLDQLLHKQLDPAAKKKSKLVGKGMPASPGAAVGVCVFTAEEAVRVRAEQKVPVVLIRSETSPEDIQGMQIAQGVLTQRGGMTSHAAVVARGMGRCCITGCENVSIYKNQSMTLNGVTFAVGDWITLDGSTGEVFQGKLATADPVLSDEYQLLMGWADEIRTLKVRTNADTPEDAAKAVSFGAQGIGLVRTEHMFFAEDRINIMRTMILANGLEERKKALERLLPFQQQDFEGIFKAMTGKPVIIRLLDPPFHEFLPHEDNEIRSVAALVPGATPESVKRQIHALAESNPMLGFRGCRLGIVFPEITEMQVRAIFMACLKVKSEGFEPIPEIEVPLVGNLAEFLPFKDIVKKIAQQTGVEGKIHYAVGSMIEVPRAALCADDLAAECDFLSYGTNDLTQMTCGFSRDDASKFLVDYVRKGIYERDPFTSIDTEGVGKMMKICVALARGVKPDIDIGICGEHGGEPTSVEFCHRIGLSNVSCSPFRVPIARLAAAQARIKFGPQPKTLDLLSIFKNSSSTGASKL